MEISLEILSSSLDPPSTAVANQNASLFLSLNKLKKAKKK
jgi:hypothetical protein